MRELCTGLTVVGIDHEAEKFGGHIILALEIIWLQQQHSHVECHGRAQLIPSTLESYHLSYA